MESTAQDISHLSSVQIKTEPDSVETPDRTTLLAVLQVLRKYNLKVSIYHRSFIC